MADSLIFFLNSFVTLFSVLDPFGAAAIFLALTQGDSAGRRQAQAMRAVRSSMIILLFFALAGEMIFSIFGISVQALMVAGGLILIHLAFKMLEGKSPSSKGSGPEREEAEFKDDIAIIPMAIPMLAGPAAITSVVVFANRASSGVEFFSLLLAIGAVLGITYQALKQSETIAALLGETGLRIMVRIMGLILISMGVEFVLSAVKIYFT